MHEGFLERAAKGDIDLLFLGDSITAGWNKSAESRGPREVWERYYGPRHAANFGIDATTVGSTSTGSSNMARWTASSPRSSSS